MAHAYLSRSRDTVRFALPLALLCLVTACVETDGASIGLTAPTASAVGQDNGGDTVSVALRPRDDGSQTLTVSGGLDYSCTGILDEAPSARGSELTTITCTDGNNGTATVVYNASAEPSQAVFSRPGENVASLRF